MVIQPKGSTPPKIINPYLPMVNINKKFIIPGVAKRDFSTWKESNADRTAPIETTAFLIAWRAQVSATLSGQITVSEIQQLPTMRFIARQLSTNYQCKRLAATIAVIRVRSPGTT